MTLHGYTLEMLSSSNKADPRNPAFLRMAEPFIVVEYRNKNNVIMNQSLLMFLKIDTLSRCWLLMIRNKPACWPQARYS